MAEPPMKNIHLVHSQVLLDLLYHIFPEMIVDRIQNEIREK